MRRIFAEIFVTLSMAAPLAADERTNLLIDDVIAGLEAKKLFYFELLLQNGKYTKGFNKCLGSKPAAAEWMQQHCKKDPELKNAFQCSEDNQLTHVWFINENAAQFEEIRGPMKDKMNALRTE
jgi:hypothetical protein